MNALSSDAGFLTAGLLLALIVLLLTMLAGLLRAWSGPAFEDRLSALLLVGSTGVAMLFLLAELLQRPSFYDIALVLALLAVVITVALTQRGHHGHD